MCVLTELGCAKPSPLIKGPDGFLINRHTGEHHLQFGVDNEWWEGIDLKRDAPIPFPLVFIIKTRELRRKNSVTKLWETIDTLTDKENTMAHLLAKFGVFESVGEAKRNGAGKPISEGEHWFKKKTVRIVVEAE